MNFKRENSLIRPHTDFSVTDKDYFIGLSFVPIIILSLMLVFILFLVTCYFIPKCRIRNWKYSRWVVLFFTLGAIVSWLVAFGISASHARFNLNGFVQAFKEIQTLVGAISIKHCSDTDPETDPMRDTLESLRSSIKTFVDLLSIVSKVVDKVFLARTIVAAVIAALTAMTIPVLYRHKIYVLVVPMLTIAMIVACALYVFALVSVDVCYPDVDENILRVIGEIGKIDQPDCTSESMSDSVLALCYYQTCEPGSLFESRYLNQTLEYPEITPPIEDACPGIGANLNKTTDQINDIMDHLRCEHFPYDTVIRHSFCKVQTGHQVRLFYAYISSCTLTMVAILVVMFLVVEEHGNQVVDAHMVAYKSIDS